MRHADQLAIARLPDHRTDAFEKHFIVFNDGDVDHAEPVSLKMLQINNNATRSEKPVAPKTQCIQNSHPKFNAHQAKIIQPVAAQLPICIADRD
jgi:hypothetical protein